MLLKHSHAQLFTYCLWQLSWDRLSSCNRDHVQILKYLLLLYKKLFGDPCFKIILYNLLFMKERQFPQGHRGTELRFLASHSTISTIPQRFCRHILVCPLTLLSRDGESQTEPLLGDQMVKAIHYCFPCLSLINPAFPTSFIPTIPAHRQKDPKRHQATLVSTNLHLSSSQTVIIAIWNHRLESCPCLDGYSHNQQTVISSRRSSWRRNCRASYLFSEHL